jgi:hypothetical protein
VSVAVSYADAPVVSVPAQAVLLDASKTWVDSVVAVAVQVVKLDVLLPGTGSFSFAVTVAVLVTQVLLVVGAVPESVIVKLALAASAPSEHVTVLPLSLQPAVDDVTLVTPAGTGSLTA